VRVYIVADLEGTSGVSGYDVYRDEVPGEVFKHRDGRALWAAEVNAAVKGAVGAGATEITVLDNHGSGDTFPFQLLHSSAGLIHGRGRSTWLPGLDSSIDAVLIAGQHAMAGSGGHLAHTYSRRRIRRVLINEQDVGEIGLIAAIAGAHGVPVVLVSGDDVATTEGEVSIPGVQALAVKQTLSIESCLSFARDETLSSIEHCARRGIETRNEISPMSIGGKGVTLKVDYRLRDGWRVPARFAVYGGRRGAIGGLRRLRLTETTVQRAWDRFLHG